MKLKRILALLLAMTMIIGSLAACTSSQQPAEEPAEEPETVEEEEDEENYETGDASLDDPLNQDGIGINELLVVSFGTSFNDSRRLTIGAIEKDLAAAFPEFDVRRAFTAQIVIDHVQKRDGEVIDNLEQALDRAVANGVRNIIIQPTHLMEGFEYNDIMDTVDKYADAFNMIGVSRALLSTFEDMDEVAKIVHEETVQYDDGETAIVFMGHGTEAASNRVYADMQDTFNKLNYKNYFMGTVEAEPSLEDVVKAAKDGGYKRVVLEPLMIVCGDHANNDMAGDEEDSWKSTFEAEGFEVICNMKGLGELQGIRDLIVKHCQNTIDFMDEDFGTGDASKDDPLNQDGIGEKELLVVSFGTSFNDSRVATIGSIEKALAAAFPEWSTRRGFTAQIIIDHVQRRDGEVIDNFEQAMDRAVANGVKDIVIQPTHLMAGYEYDDIVASAANYADAFDSITIGKNLLSSDEDFTTVAQIVHDSTAQYDDGETAIIFMGHGTEHESNAVYPKMQETFKALGYDNYFMGTVEAEPSLEDVLAAAKEGGYKKVVLEALMIVCGDHANNDMAGDEEDSWKSTFEAEGFEVECIMKGLGEFEGIQQLIVKHCQETMAEAGF
ncbi:MAG: sirohydrochlorin cobaltochelatase [Clostridia bacterium]|nr:sirohydrochlorin cobaltochelatase [Clostridia bacterium]